MADAPTDPREDAERIRLKRLAKLQGALASSSVTSTPGQSPSPAPFAASTSKSTPPPVPKPATPPVRSQPTPPPPVKKAAVPAPVAQPAVASPIPQKRPQGPVHLDLPTWERETIGRVLNVTLDRAVAEKSDWSIVWLKNLAAELADENPNGLTPVPTTVDILDRLLITRLELNPQSMTDDLEFLPVLVSLPPQQSVFEYLVGCWKRLNQARSALNKRGYPPVETQAALTILDQVRELIVSYAGLSLQDPDMFPQPSGRPLGAPELVQSLLHLSSLSAPLLSTSAPSTVLDANDVEPFLQDLVRRFEPENEIDSVLGPVVEALCHHESLSKPEGLAGGDAGWRGVVGGLEALVSIKAVANMIPRLDAWNPQGDEVKAHDFEFRSLFGPLLRLGVFQREWPSISTSYFMQAEGRPSTDVQSATASLRGTLKSLQSSLFRIFDQLVRASPDAREAVLQYFAHIVSLNDKRAGKYIDPKTVASDSFMVNVQAILFRFCEPFMDANYTRMDRIDVNYFNVSNRINLADETRVNATSEESENWRKQNAPATSTAPNFITEIFFITMAMNHYGYQKTLSSFEELAKHLEDMTRHREQLEGDGSWQQSPFRARIERAINQVKNEEEKIRAEQLAYVVQLTDPELVFRSVSFVNFVSTWLIRLVDPTHSYPKNNTIALPLPKAVPMAFRTLPEFVVEDVVDYHMFLMRTSPNSLELSGKNELLIWCLTFLTSTWYIKNPSVKSHLVDVLFLGTWPYDGRRALLTSLLNSHPLALEHLMSALTTVYIEVEQTGASSQFYDKFSTRRCIAGIFKTVWNNQSHREALKKETRTNMEKFIRFVNLMINDVTYLMDESLADLAKIHEIQTEMADTNAFNQQSAQHRQERESELRTLERKATSYVSLGNSTVELLKVFTAETKEPFMAPEIRDRLAAMLDYNLDALVGPRCENLLVKNPEKYKFNPRQILSQILEVYLNLSDQGEFAQAVAADGRSYKKQLFERAAGIARKRSLKTEDEIEKLRLFVLKVEETRATMEAEEDLGDIPDEFLDPLMYTIMRDPVILPSSKTTVDRATIKSHLLSDTTDPFNRQPLKFEDVLPNIELKERIDQFLSERRNKNTAFDQPAEEVVHMDTSSDIPE